MKKCFTSLEKIVLLQADADGYIKFPKSPAVEIEIYLEVLLHLEIRGYVRQEPGLSPLLPFRLSPVGKLVRSAFLNIDPVSLP